MAIQRFFLFQHTVEFSGLSFFGILNQLRKFDRYATKTVLHLFISQLKTKTSFCFVARFQWYVLKWQPQRIFIRHEQKMDIIQCPMEVIYLKIQWKKLFVCLVIPLAVGLLSALLSGNNTTNSINPVFMRVCVVLRSLLIIIW